MPTLPGPPLKVIQPHFLLELPVADFAGLPLLRHPNQIFK